MSLTQTRDGSLRRDLRRRKCDGDQFLRSDGRCAWCLEPKPKPEDVNVRSPALNFILELLSEDPFCSAECAAASWGMEAHRAKGHAVKPNAAQVQGIQGAIVRTKENVARARQFAREDKERTKVAT